MSEPLQLPPMPDRETGEPRPPRAPVIRPAKNSRQRWSRFRVPKPPPGEGPPLEWDYGSLKRQIEAFFVTMVIFIGFFTVYDLLDSDRGMFDWATDRTMWILFVVFSFLFSFGVYIGTVAAGADWLMQRKHFIKTYELTSIELEPAINKYTFELQDRYGNEVSVSELALLGNRRLWNLVYNGIRHSVVNGAYIDSRAISRLQLHREVAMRDARRSQSPEAE
ncbi:hypothetical protein [Haloechinothrix sp. LS1_15]|uniref:hypothetical protein n=1 Tax=Haloechinothrix sp. LS1_15 TaxID=2652248 RepID=UPI0029460374|nr:hypothetical protein [Haloechinothrix sp. LS1_15]MDV6012294.1 hypothetical protein [Haloechinothrix sp. LS1_15]